MTTIIHIGLHKTGTSTLQNYFRQNDAIDYIERREVQKAFVGHKESSSAKTLTIREHRAQADNKKLVISHERLSGYPASGGFDRELIAKRLKATFPDAKVLIVFREQKAWIKSFYQQYIADGGSESLPDFLSRPQPQIYKNPCFEFDYLDYFKLISFYHSLFGKEQVLALPYELMRNDFKDFAKRLDSFFDVNLELENKVINRARPLCPLLIMRALNGSIGRTQLSPGGFFPLGYLKKTSKILGKIPGARAFDKRISSNWKRTIAHKTGDYYKDSNTKLQDLVGMDLSEFGYN